MTELGSGDLTVILVAVVACILLAAGGLYLRARLRLRSQQLRSELSARPAVVSDRAFNRIAMARREAQLLARQGVDVTASTALVGQAQASFDARDFGRAYELAQSAHETLVVARTGAPIRPSPPAARTAPGPTVPTPAATPAPAPPPTPNIPKNRAESQFQLRVLTTELARARAANAKADATELAAASLAAGQAAYDRGEYTEAFRLALRGRRQIGSTIETLAPAPALRSGGTGAPADAGALATDPVAIAEQAAASDRCPNCGQPMLAADTFCRGCGTPRRATTCPACGAPRSPTDGFCGKCGTPFR
jgi:predicted RNA-binding Zn-ribbon protein involved in translation (DUF1610 family)